MGLWATGNRKVTCTLHGLWMKREKERKAVGEKCVRHIYQSGTGNL